MNWIDQWINDYIPDTANSDGTHDMDYPSLQDPIPLLTPDGPYVPKQDHYSLFCWS